MTANGKFGGRIERAARLRWVPLAQLRVNPLAALLASSLLRGAYHLYQGFSAGLGNVVMGLIFAYVWRRTGRLWPLIIAHGIIDSVAYVGYAVAAGHLGWLS